MVEVTKEAGLVSSLNLRYSRRDVVLNMLTLRLLPQPAFNEIRRIPSPEDKIVAIWFRCQSYKVIAHVVWFVYHRHLKCHAILRHCASFIELLILFIKRVKLHIFH